MSQFNDDGNILGRLGAVAILAALGFGYHKLSCGEGMCPMMKTDCCHRADAQAEAAPAAPAAATPAPAAAK